MSAAADYPGIHAVYLWSKNPARSDEMGNALAEIDHLRAHVARLKDQLANEREAADLTIQHVRTGGRIT